MKSLTLVSLILFVFFLNCIIFFPWEKKLSKSIKGKEIVTIYGRTSLASDFIEPYTERFDQTGDRHKHGGLCMTVLHSYDANGNLVRTGSANQHTTFNECQAIPNDERMPDGSSMWANFWMVHMWLYDLNPNGFFAGTHPCVDPNGLDESTINGDRNVPHFFAHH